MRKEILTLMIFLAIPVMLPAQTGQDLTIDQLIITPSILYQVGQKLENMTGGETLNLTTESYPAIAQDLEAWSRMTGHKITDKNLAENSYRFTIKKSETPRESRRIFLVISSPKFGELLTPLATALTGAIMGDEVSIFFQGKGVRVLYDHYRPGVPGFVVRQLADIGHAPAQTKLQLIQQLGGRIYACGPSMDQFGRRPEDLYFEDITVCEYFTVYELMEQADLVLFLQ